MEDPSEGAAALVRLDICGLAAAERGDFRASFRIGRRDFDWSVFATAGIRPDGTLGTAAIAEISPIEDAILRRLHAEALALLAHGETLPTPRQACEDDERSWPTFLPWQSWTDGEEPAIAERLRIVSEALTHLHGRAPDRCIFAVLQAGAAGKPADIRLSGAGLTRVGDIPELTRYAEELFFQGDWTRDRFAGRGATWIGRQSASGARSRIPGHFESFRRSCLGGAGTAEARKAFLDSLSDINITARVFTIRSPFASIKQTNFPMRSHRQWPTNGTASSPTLTVP